MRHSDDSGWNIGKIVCLFFLMVVVRAFEGALAIHTRLFSKK